MSNFKVQGNASGAGTFTLQSPNIAGNLSLTMPAADGTSNQALVTNGSGVLSFATVTSPPGGSNNQVQYNSAGAFAGSANLTFDGTTFTVASRGIAKAGMPAGSVLQVVQHTTTSATSTTSTSYVTTNSSASITPTSTTSTILILVSGICRNANNGQNMMVTVYRGGTNLAPSASRGFAQFSNSAGSTGNTDTSQAFMYLDSPSTTSSTTYTVYIKSENGQSSTWAIDSSYGSITLMEIAA